MKRWLQELEFNIGSKTENKETTTLSFHEIKRFWNHPLDQYLKSCLCDPFGPIRERTIKILETICERRYEKTLQAEDTSWTTFIEDIVEEIGLRRFGKDRPPAEPSEEIRISLVRLMPRLLETSPRSFFRKNLKEISNFHLS